MAEAHAPAVPKGAIGLLTDARRPQRFAPKMMGRLPKFPWHNPAVIIAISSLFTAIVGTCNHSDSKAKYDATLKQNAADQVNIGNAVIASGSTQPWVRPVWSK